MPRAVCRALVIAGLTGLVGCAASTTRASTTDGVGHTATVTRRLLAGEFPVPAGFRVVRVFPPPSAAGVPGVIAASVLGPQDDGYRVAYSTVNLPCSAAACPSPTVQFHVGDAELSPNMFDPHVGTLARCGSPADNSKIGCDAIVGDEYTLVLSTSASFSAADAEALLVTAVRYLKTTS